MQLEIATGVRDFSLDFCRLEPKLRSALSICLAISHGRHGRRAAGATAAAETQADPINSRPPPLRGMLRLVCEFCGMGEALGEVPGMRVKALGGVCVIGLKGLGGFGEM